MDVFDQEVGYRRMMTRVLTVELGSVMIFALKCLSEQRIKRFVLATAHVDAANCKRDN